MNLSETKLGLTRLLLRLRTNQSEYLGLVKGPLLVKVLGVALAYLLAIALTRKFGASAFGLYSICLVILGIASEISRLGMDYASVKFIPAFLVRNDKSQVSTYYQKSLLIIVALSILASAILYYSSNSLSLFVFEKPELDIYLKAFAFAITPFSIIQYHAQFTRSFNSAVKSTLLTTLLIPAFALLILLFLIQQPNSTFNDIYYVYVLACIISGAVSFALLQRDFSNNGISHLDYARKFSISSVLKVSIPMFFFQTSLMLTTWTNTLMLGRYSSAEDVAVYSVVVRLAGLSVLVLTTTNTIFAPKFSSHFARNDYASMRSETLKATKLNFWLGLPIQLLLLVSSGILLDLFGEEFRQGLIPLFVMVGAQILNSVCGPVTQILNMANSQVFLSKLTLVLFVFTVVSNLFLLQFVEPVLAVTITIAANYLLLNAVCVLYIKSKWGFSTVYIPGARTT